MKRARNRKAQAVFRAKLKKPDPEQARIDKFIAAEEDGNFDEADRIVAPEYGKELSGEPQGTVLPMLIPPAPTAPAPEDRRPA
jgi:hypothetical protein